ncbi:MAG: TetR/AcrR family transcriptional regulator [Pseudonocardiaceae bacterium]
MRAIRQHGPEVAMDDIATEAGISKPILYRHFEDKGDLYMAVSETATHNLRTALLSDLDTGADPRTLLRLLIESYLRFIEQDPELYRFVVRRSFTDRPLPRDPVTTNAALISGALATIFSDQLRGLGMEPGGAQTWAHAGVGMVQAAGDWWLQHRTVSLEELRDYLLMMAWGSLDAILQAGGSPGNMLRS